MQMNVPMRLWIVCWGLFSTYKLVTQIDHENNLYFHCPYQECIMNRDGSWLTALLMVFIFFVVPIVGKAALVTMRWVMRGADQNTGLEKRIH